MVVWKWFIIVVILALVSGEVRADLPLFGRASPGRTNGPQSYLSEIGNVSSSVDELQSNPLAELIIQTGIWKESSGVDAVQTDPHAKPINKTGNGKLSELDEMNDYVPSEFHENAIQSELKNFSAKQLFHLLTEIFSRPHGHLGPVFGRPKQSNNGLNNPSQEPVGTHSSKVKRSDDNGENTSQKPIPSSDPFQPIKDALYEYAEQIAKHNPSQDAPKKKMPETLEELNRLSADDIRDLSYQYISVEEHTKILYRGMTEDLTKPYIERESRDRINGFWKWFRSSYVPKNMDNIDVRALADAQWLGISKLQDGLNSNPDEAMDEDLDFFGRLLKFFNVG